MSNKPKLNDLQLILLSTAAQRDDGNVFPVADSIAKDEERVRKAILPLLKRGLVDEQAIKDRRLIWREEGEQLIGLCITSAGQQLIAPVEAGKHSTEVAGEKTPAAEKNTANARTGSKVELVIGLLRRAEGATLNELVDATGWLPHTTRAAMTGLRKKGHVLEKSKREDVTCYRIAEVA